MINQLEAPQEIPIRFYSPRKLPVNIAKKAVLL